MGNQTKVICAELDVSDVTLARHRDLLTVEESYRAARLPAAHLRSRLVSARAFLRLALALHLGIRPADVAILRAGSRKPMLAAPDESSRSLHFNLSHSDRIAVLAINDSTPVGIDVEKIDPNIDCDAVAKDVFSVEERASLAALPARSRLAAFVSTWTRKEAFLKGLGEGLTRQLDQFTVSTDPNEAPTLLAVPFAPHLVGQWSLHTVPVGERFAATLAVNAPDTQLTLLTWEW